ncbi:MAG: hypothetical protein AB1665_00980 [Candidatus Thermoplasmatota archaeon]
MPKGALSTTVEERILIYLSDHRVSEGGYEYPLALTQRSIAGGVGIQQKHLSRYLRGMKVDGLLDEKKARVEGCRQKMNVYLLSSMGWERTRALREHLGQKMVRILIDGRLMEMMISQIDKATSVHLKLSDILRHAEEQDPLDMKRLEEVEERHRRQADERSRKSAVYKQALATAWRSGILTPSERSLVNALKEHLCLDEEECMRIEEEVVREADHQTPDRRELYEEMRDIAYSQGEPPQVAKEMLALLRKRLHIPEDTVC